MISNTDRKPRAIVEACSQKLPRSLLFYKYNENPVKGEKNNLKKQVEQKDFIHIFSICGSRLYFIKFLFYTFVTYRLLILIFLINPTIMKVNSYLLIIALFAAMFLTACSDDDKKEQGPDPDPTPNLSLEDILELPYSELTPEQQKIKLENQSIALLDMANDTKNSAAIKTFQNLTHLIDISNPELVKGEKTKTIEDAFEYADVYGIHTWNNGKWVKTNSQSELKFVFPSKKGSSSNDAELVIKAESSGIPVDIRNTDEYWDSEKNTWIEEVTETRYYLPKSAEGFIKINGSEIGTVALKADYKNEKEVPEKMEVVANLEKYTFETIFNKAAENEVASVLKKGNDTMFYAYAAATIKIDEVFDKVIDVVKVPDHLFGKVKSYIKILDDLIIVATGDAANMIKELNALDDEFDAKWDALYEYEHWKMKDYYTIRNQYDKEYCEKSIAIRKKYMTVTLASTDDATKIATLEEKAEADYSWSAEVYWDENEQEWKDIYEYNPETSDYEKMHEADPNAKYDYYEAIPYLRFNDNTLVSADNYFSTGFNVFIKKWEDFVAAFNE
ncbi:hypothetical protein [Parabacteroides sp. PF5-9]|uniref:hypothetical protein n=1 Tax=Parabacteroides sp. PF5-9 TaxID=1742404 RepID=UPI002476B8B3|nr:hypothetical protein [Parabacteroides sp. PF5-9]MDH6356583.1 hypothetical protein [Parabacteroides sp. PF5-9]